MAFRKITEGDMLGKGNVGRPDTPGVSTAEMQRIMDELPREVIAPAFNELSGQLEANTASADIGANAPDGITPDPAPAENSPAKLQSVLQGIVNKITDHIADQVKHVTSEERTLWNNASNDRHTHDNKSILDGITSSLVGNWNAAFAHISDAVRHITENERTNWNDKYTKSETDKAINERVVEIGSSDMTKAVYDPETRNLPYIPKIDAEALTLGKNVVLSGAPVSIAYAGTNRIASITAYGENAQGGTTEAPVALTGISSVTVNDDVTELPIPRPLRRVGDVRDKCITRVKSVYDKRVVLDGSSDEVFIQTNIIDGWIQIATESDAVIPESTSIVGSIKSSYLKAYAIEEVYSKKYSGISVDSNRRIRLSFKTSEYPDVTSVETARTYLSAHPLTVYYQSTAYNGTNGLDVCLTEYQTGYIESYADESITTAWISSTGALSTGAEVAYVLNSPETYATDPLDIDNSAGPLTVMTGGELEVRMTELVGNREFTERLSYIGNPNLLDNSNFTNPVNQRDGTSYSASTGNAAYAIDRWRIEGATYTVATHTLSGTSYTNRACRMAQFIEMVQYGLNIGDDMTFSIMANGTKHSATAKILDRDQYSSFENVPSAYSCDDFDIVLCTGLSKPSILSFTICPKKALVLEWAKLEKGSVATPYVHKSYGAELSACQRYFYYLDATKWYACYQITGWGLIIPIDLPVPMRAQPTANTVGEVKVFTPSGWVNATSVSTNQFNRDKARINIVLTMPSGSMDSYEGRAMVATGIESLSADL
nr:MAG TPA: tail fiber protein [Caudoviricetes sp.]